MPCIGWIIGTISGTRTAVTRFISTVYVVIPATSPPSLRVTTAAAVAVAAGFLLYQPAVETGKKENVIVKKQDPKKPVMPKKVEKKVVAKDDSGLTENFDEQIFAFALDVGTGMSSVSETLDSVSETMDYMI